MTAIAPPGLVERIWERDATLWTGHDEAHWLGWLDEPLRMRERIDQLLRFGEDVLDEGLDTTVVLGMGGSSLAPIVLKHTFEARHVHVLDTTHPALIRHAEQAIDLERSLFIASSKSGTTLETRSHLDYFWERVGRRGERFVAITDPGSPLEQLARERGFRAVFAGEPTVGGRYSALSPFGMVPAVLMGIDLNRLLERAVEMLDACRLAEGNPGLELGLELGEGWRDGRDKVCVPESESRFGVWVEQLLAESTGKQGKGLVPAPGESGDGPDRQWHGLRLEAPYELSQEFYRWEFATAVAGSILAIDPFDQPNVQEAKDRTAALLESGRDIDLDPEGTVDELVASVEPGNYVAVQAFVDPRRQAELEPLLERVRRQTGCVVTFGLGPRYLHSTGQLQKGGPPIGRFIQVVDDPGPELPIPNQKFGFARLIQAQAAGDFQALKERGRPAVRVRLEDLQ